MKNKEDVQRRRQFINVQVKSVMAYLSSDWIGYQQPIAI